MLREWIRTHNEPMLARAKALCGDEHLAKDLWHGTVERMLVHEHRQETIRCFEAWAVTIMTRRYWDHLKRVSTRRESDEVEPATIPQPEPDEIPESARFTVSEVLAAMEQIAPGDRAIFRLREAEGLKYREISDRTGLPSGTVATTLRRVRARLREILLERRAGAPAEGGKR